MQRTLFVSAVALCLFSSCSRAPTVAPEQPSAATPTGTVTLEFVIDENTKVLTIDDVHEGATLESVLLGVTDPVVSVRGSGTTAFVDKIGDVATSANEGWTFSVDGEWANEGVGSIKLQPPTTVRWEFGSWDK